MLSWHCWFSALCKLVRLHIVTIGHVCRLCKAKSEHPTSQDGHLECGLLSQLYLYYPDCRQPILQRPCTTSSFSQPHLSLVEAPSSPPFFHHPHNGSPVCFLGIHLTVGKANKTETLGKTSSPKSLLIFGKARQEVCPLGSLWHPRECKCQSPPQLAQNCPDIIRATSGSH